ncbi:MAG: hypothetical protein NTU47_12590 [Ignavibacteriales bacterium]|nr:hypothetical protein [Ignavibacteriales bacterium]
MRRYLSVCVVTAFAFTMTAFAIPRFATQLNLPCQSCHVNPSGGGMRNAFGQSFGSDSLSLKSTREAYAIDDFSTKIGEFMSYGADFRFLAFYQSRTNPDASLSSFFPMQMDLYFNLAVSKKISLYINPAFGPYNRLEAFGIARILPANGYLKLGRFAPPYGLRFDDHTSFIRQATPFRNNMGQQTGLELGFRTGSVVAMGALTNGTRGDLDGILSKAVFGKLEAHGELGPLNAMAGVSSYNDVSSVDKLNLLGGYASATFMDRLTILGDVERIQGNSSSMSLSSDLNQRNTPGTDRKQLAVLIEADYKLLQGVELKFMYDFFDPNTDVKSGTAVRYSGGFEIMPVSGVEVRPLFRYTKDTILNRNSTDLQILVHLYL